MKKINTDRGSMISGKDAGNIEGVQNILRI
jgi:hypothetical protein